MAVPGIEPSTSFTLPTGLWGSTPCAARTINPREPTQSAQTGMDLHFLATFETSACNRIVLPYDFVAYLIKIDFL